MGPRRCVNSFPLLGPLRLANGCADQGSEVAVLVSEHSGFDAPGAAHDGVREAARRHEAEDDVAVAEPAFVHDAIPRRVEGKSRAVEALLIQSVVGWGCVPALLEIPAELLDCFRSEPDGQVL